MGCRKSKENMNNSTRRALHFVFKIGNRFENARFYREVLGMKILRHEEFMEGCKATCNGPYDGKWSKSMVGYGPEDNNFVMELTYNYGVGYYKLGNDFRGVTIQSSNILNRAASANLEMNGNLIKSPDGYPFIIESTNSNNEKDTVVKVTLTCTDVDKSKEFWTRLCGMQVVTSSPKSVTMHFAEGQCKLELVQLDEPTDRAAAFGRFAISCPTPELSKISELMTEKKQTILTPLVSLDTPGKATVTVIIVADPDGHEICFVGDEGFRTLSQVDPAGDKLLNEAMDADKSDEWFAKKKLTKVSELGSS